MIWSGLDTVSDDLPRLRDRRRAEGRGTEAGRHVARRLWRRVDFDRVDFAASRASADVLDPSAWIDRASIADVDRLAAAENRCSVGRECVGRMSRCDRAAVAHREPDDGGCAWLHRSLPRPLLICPRPPEYLPTYTCLRHALRWIAQQERPRRLAIAAATTVPFPPTTPRSLVVVVVSRRAVSRHLGPWAGSVGAGGRAPSTTARRVVVFPEEDQEAPNSADALRSSPAQDDQSRSTWWGHSPAGPG